MTRLLSTAGLLEKRVVAFRELHVGLDERKLLTGEVGKFFFKNESEAGCTAEMSIVY